MDPVIVVPYDINWQEQFDRERSLLHNVFRDIPVVVEHVGSTAVPGLASKPIIDLMLGARALADVESRIEALRAHHYEYVPAYETQLPDRRYFRKPFSVPRTHHLHCVVFGSSFWRDDLLFRDYLRANPGAAAEYAALKRELASRHRLDRSAYVEGKTSFVQSILAKAGARSAPNV